MLIHKPNASRGLSRNATVSLIRGVKPKSRGILREYPNEQDKYAKLQGISVPLRLRTCSTILRLYGVTRHTLRKGSRPQQRLLVCASLLVCLAIVFQSILPALSAAGEYHVDARRGDDRGSGAFSDPYRTIRRVSEELQAGDTAIIHPGVYHEQIMTGNSGRKGAPITYQGTDPAQVILDGSVRVTDWKRVSKNWVKKGLKPITPVNAFVMVDEKRLLKRAPSVDRIEPGRFYLAKDGTYTIRLWNDANPNTDHHVDVYELDMAFNAGDRWGGNSRRWIVLKNLTLQKYGGHAISTDMKKPADSDHWELDGLIVRYNYHEGVFSCLDDWLVHGCSFVRNRGHGCQLNGARIRFVRNESSDNEWFGNYEHGGCGILLGPDGSCTDCEVRDNIFRDNGDPMGYGCGIYLEGRSHGNTIERNFISGATHAGIGFYGSSHNMVSENLLENIAPDLSSESAGAFVVGPSFEGEANPALGNLVLRNKVRDCPTPIACVQLNQVPDQGPDNIFEENVFAGCRYKPTIDPRCRILEKNNSFLDCPVR